MAPFEEGLESKGDKRKASEKNGESESGDVIILIVQDLHLERDRVGQAANMPGDDGHSAELAHGARIAEQHAIEQAPFDIGQRHREESLQAGRAERQRRLFLHRPLLLHQRNEFARDEGKRDEDRRKHDARNRKHDLYAVRGYPLAEQTLRAEDENVDEAGDDRRHRERQIDQRDQQALARKREFRDRPGRREAEDEIGGTAMAATAGSGGSRRARRDRRRPSKFAEALRQRLAEYDDQRRKQEQRQKNDCHADQRKRAAGASCVTDGR